jgi:hypothetical protein
MKLETGQHMAAGSRGAGKPNRRAGSAARSLFAGALHGIRDAARKRPHEQAGGDRRTLIKLVSPVGIEPTTT